MITIRQRTDADLDACVNALSRVHESDGYPRGISDYKKFLTEDIQQAWVAEQDGHIIGHVSIDEATETDLAVALWKKAHPNDAFIAVLGRLYVLSEGRKGRTAVKLVAAAVEASTKTGNRLLLWVVIANQAAIRLYDRLGWVRFGTSIYNYDEGTSMEAICFASPSSK